MKPIRIHHADSEEEVRARHKRIEERLEAYGADQVRATMGHAFPTEWNPIITAWLAGGRLEASNGDD